MPSRLIVGRLPAPQKSIAAALQSVSRDQFFAGLSIVLCANGIASVVPELVRAVGAFNALLASFNISAVVWIACFAGPWLLLKNDFMEDLTATDIAGGLIVMGCALAPMGKLSWLGLTGLSLYIVRNSEAGTTRRRGALILLAATGPMLWGPLLLTVFVQPIVRADAIIVADLIGTPRFGNMINFAGSSRAFQISTGCSSLHGVSIAILAWTTITQIFRDRPSLKDAIWCLLAIFAVVAVNDIRLSLMALYPDYFEIIHGAPGSAIASWTSLALILAICLFGVRREIFAPGQTAILKGRTPISGSQCRLLPTSEDRRRSGADENATA